MRVLALDLGGSRLKAGVVADGILEEIRIEPAPADGARASIETAVAQIAQGWSFDGIGLCVPGLVDASGTVVALPGKHAGIEGLNLGSILRELTDAARIVIVNDAIAYATGEAAAGAGSGHERVVVVTIGTGVGVTVIQRGAPITTGTVGGGILGGFIPISERTDGPADSIGRPDTIEALCAASRLAEACGTGTVEDAFAAVARGDATARAGIDAYRAHLVRALTALASAHAPGCIVLGGGPMTADNPVTPGVADLVNARMYGTYRVELRIAALGDSAALVGLAHFVETL